MLVRIRRPPRRSSRGPRRSPVGRTPRGPVSRPCRCWRRSPRRSGHPRSTQDEIRDGAWVADLTWLLELKRWPKGLRVIARKARPHPGARLRLTNLDVMRLTVFQRGCAEAAGGLLRPRVGAGTAQAGRPDPDLGGWEVLPARLSDRWRDKVLPWHTSRPSCRARSTTVVRSTHDDPSAGPSSTDREPFLRYRSRTNGGEPVDVASAGSSCCWARRSPDGRLELQLLFYCDVERMCANRWN